MPVDSPVVGLDTTVHQKILMVDGMHCSSCAIAIEAALKKHPRVSNANVNFAADVAIIYWNDDEPDFGELQTTIARLGYQLHQNTNDKQRQQYALHIRKNLQLRLAVAIMFGMWSMMPALLIYLSHFDIVEQNALLPLAFASGLFSIPVIVYSGSHFYRVGWRTLMAGAPGLDTLISVAVFSACIISVYKLLIKSPEVYFDTAVMLITFQLIARLLDTGVRRRATDVIHRLLQDFPAEIIVLGAQGYKKKCLIDDVKIGQLIFLEAGETLSFDALVIRGVGLVDVSMLSGEHTPQTVNIGDTLFAGCKLIEGPIELVVSHTIGQRRIDALSRSMSILLGQKTALQLLTDRVARILLPIVITAAMYAVGLAFLEGLSYTEMAVRALAVIIVTCPCALSLAIPLVITMGHARMIENGIILREPSALESASDIKVIVFDKTGTLTTYQPSIKSILPQPGISEDKLLQLALNSLIESSHPVAMGLINATQNTHKADESGIRESFVGQGCQWSNDNEFVLVGNADWLKHKGINVLEDGDIGMNIHLALNGTYVGQIVFQETLQPAARAVTHQLRQQGYSLYMLSGDTQQACYEIGDLLGFSPSHVLFNRSPEDKHIFIKDLQKKAKVAFVGDGLNDGLALASATLGIAVGEEAHPVTSAASAIYLSGSINKLELTLSMAKRARLLMRQNLAWAVGYNVVVIPIAAMGWVQPVIAAIAMSLSSLCVLFNSLRMSVSIRNPSQ